MTRPIRPGTNDVLLIVDIQNDFCPGGALAVPDGDAVIPVVNRVAESFEHIILTQDWHPRGHLSFASSHAGRKPYDVIGVSYGEQVLWPDHCVQGSEGAAFLARRSARRIDYPQGFSSRYRFLFGLL